MDKEQAWCYTCPIRLHCWDEKDIKSGISIDLKYCPLYKLVAGDVKIETSGYLKFY